VVETIIFVPKQSGVKHGLCWVKNFKNPFWVRGFH
jgi:hypothetical protein